MKKTNFLIFSLKKMLYPCLLCFFTLCLLVFSKTNLSAAKDGLALWANQVVPSLLPFFIATELLGYTQVVPFLGRLFQKWMRPLFHVPGEGSFAFFMGLISGSPMGAKIVTKFYEEGTATKEECERLLSFTNNAGPLFILGTVGISMLGMSICGYLLLFTHILACITVGILFRYWKRNASTRTVKQKKCPTTTSSTAPLGQMLQESILHSIQTIVLIGGFIVLFSVLISILKQSHLLDGMAQILTPFLQFFGIDAEFSKPVLTGLFEMTNGLRNVSLITTKHFSTILVLCAFLLGFGGISIGLQVLSVISKTDLSIAPYFIGKLLQGIFASLYTFLCIQWIPLFQLDLAQTASVLGDKLSLNTHFSVPFIGIAFLATLLVYLKFSKRKLA